MRYLFSSKIYNKYLLIFSLQRLVLSFIKLPIYKYPSNPPNKTLSYEYNKYFIENNLYTFLETGTPPQKIIAKLNFNEYPFYIYYNRCEIFSNFDLEKSNSYNIRPHQYLLTDVYVYTHLVNDFFNFPGKENVRQYKLTYLFSPLNNGSYELKLPHLPYTCAEIGLKLSTPDLKSYNYNFVRELKLSNAIKDYSFFIEYDEKDDNKGYIIIGEEPYNYNNNKYKYSQLKEVNAIHIKRELYWHLKFNLIYFKKKVENNFVIKNLTIFDAALDYNLNLILGSYEYMEYIEKEFFKDKIKNNLCQKNYLKNNYYNYECYNLEDIKEFPTLYFVHRNFGFTFEFNYKDIFIEYNGKYICLIWFYLSERESWRLGKPFLKKYFFSFNSDRKIIGFYNLNKKVNNDKEINERNILSKFIYSIIIILLLLIVLFLCYNIAKKIYIKKSKKIFTPNNLSEMMYMNKNEKIYD
jgi:hypothetical protein